jgi:hypothetical protein
MLCWSGGDRHWSRSIGGAGRCVAVTGVTTVKLRDSPLLGNYCCMLASFGSFGEGFLVITAACLLAPVALEKIFVLFRAGDVREGRHIGGS